MQKSPGLAVLAVNTTARSGHVVEQARVDGLMTYFPLHGAMGVLWPAVDMSYLCVAQTTSMGLNDLSLRDGRYDGILHMVTAACGAEEHYSLENNEARSESIDAAKQVSEKPTKLAIASRPLGLAIGPANLGVLYGVPHKKAGDLIEHFADPPCMQKRYV